ncbi:MAG: protein phosphatase CheZ [Desulfovibrionaceae bacterium]
MKSDELVLGMMENISQQMVASLKETLSEAITETVTRAVEREIADQLSRALLEGEFYRRINEDLQDGLKDIYQEIKTVRAPGAPAGGAAIEADADPDALFNEASDQLDAVLKTTEKAAEDIIAIVERLQDLQFSVSKIVKGFESGGVTKEDREKLKQINNTLGNDLSTIMISMSFQDLTGQRIKRIIEAIRKVEDIVRQVIVSTGLMIQAREEEPEMDFDALEEEAKSKATHLTGPSLDANQGDVDDLLAQFGL